jgi:hypothetical protein
MPFFFEISRGWEQAFQSGEGTEGLLKVVAARKKFAGVKLKIKATYSHPNGYSYAGIGELIHDMLRYVYHGRSLDDIETICMGWNYSEPFPAREVKNFVNIQVGGG